MSNTPLEVISLVIVHFGMKVCSKEMNMTGVEKLSTNITCTATAAQEYETVLIRTITGKVVENKIPKYCTTQIVCVKPRSNK